MREHITENHPRFCVAPPLLICALRKGSNVNPGADDQICSRCIDLLGASIGKQICAHSPPKRLGGMFSSWSVTPQLRG